MEFPGLQEALSVFILYYCRYCLSTFNTDFEGVVGYNFVAQECAEALGLRRALERSDHESWAFEGSWTSDLWELLDKDSRDFVGAFIRSRYVSPLISEASRASLPFYSSQCLEAFPPSLRPLLMAAHLLHELGKSLDATDQLLTSHACEEVIPAPCAPLTPRPSLSMPFSC